jgi:hypothetical protein
MRNGWTWGAAWIPILTLCWALGGCSDNTAAPGDGTSLCTDDEDCPVGQTCFAGICQVPGGDDGPHPCDQDSDCPAGHTCDQGFCRAGNDGGLDGDGGDVAVGGPDIEILEPAASGNPPAYLLDFGSVLVGEPVERTIRLRNAGTEDLRILDLAFEMGTVDDFYLDPATSASLPITVLPGDELGLSVYYRASDGLNDYGVLAIISNDQDEARVPIQLESTFKGAADIAVAPPNVNFGDVLTGDQAQLTLTISNQGSGNAVLTLQGVQLASMVQDHFALLSMPAFPVFLNRGDALDVAIEYHPAATGAHLDRVVIVSSDPDEPQVEVSVQGRGVLPDLIVSPAPIDLGEVRVGDTFEIPVTLTNGGGAPLAITGLGLSSASVEFFLTSDPVAGFDLANLSDVNPQVLQPTESRTLSVGYTPTETGSDEATLLIDSPDLDPSPREVAVLADGYVPPVIDVSPLELDFGDLHVRGSLTMPVTVTNLGERFLAVGNISVSGGMGAFSTNPSSLPNLGAQESSTVQVGFSPQTIGGREGWLTLASNDPALPLVAVHLLGNAIDPNIFVLPMPPIDFGQVYRGQTSEITVFVSNVGVGPLEVSDITISAGSSNDFRLTNLPVLPAVLPNSSDNLTFTLQFTPSAVGDDSGAIRIDSSDLDSPVRLVTLLGEGIGCPAGQWDINGDPADGCEYLCNLTNSGTEACDSIDNDCDALTDEDFDLTSNPAHCGVCNNDCTYAHANGVCSSSVCQMGSCHTNFWDANGQPGDGCEYACVQSNGGTERCDSVDNDCDAQTDEDFDLSSDESNCGSCGRVCSLNEATPICVSGQCQIDSCNAGFDDCDGLAINGCETNLVNDPDNCNACFNVCWFPNAPAVCNTGVCEPGDCSGAFADCDADPANGCEVNTGTSESHCGGCGLACSDPSEVCVVGVCRCGSVGPDCQVAETCCGIDCVDTMTDRNHCGGCGVACQQNEECILGQCACGGSGLDCDPTEICCGTECFDPLASNDHCGVCGTSCDPNEACTTGQCKCGGTGNDCDLPMSCCGTNCVDTMTDEAHCGQCNLACNTPHTNERCETGVCVMISCHAGWSDCGPPPGCETNTGADVANCGSCGLACVNPHGSTACTSGLCSPTCDPLWGNCDSSPNNGCEQALTTLQHCGVCGQGCSLPNATETCATGACQVDTCAAGWANCDGAHPNGCEINIDSSTANCGACGTVCSNPNGTTSCAGGVCTPTCSAGWGNCDSNPNNGCETFTDGNVNHCGACGTACLNPNGTTSCSAGVCQPVCSAGYGNCDSNPINGCETNTNTSTSNCGACGTQCTNPNGSTSCASGVCAPTCNAGWGNCDANPNNGCETNTNTSTANCGACGMQCTNPNGSTSCAAGVCVPSCSAGYADCDGNPTNGCETNLNTSTGNCGACGTQCTNPNGSTACAGGVCTPSCSAGWGNCDANPVNGCETNINTSTGNCGACGTQCTNPNGSTACAGGVCTPSCSAGWGNCDANPINGCETNTNSSMTNCGTCGTQCTNPNGSTSCTNGVCTPTCTAGWGNCDANPVNGCETFTDGNVNHCGTCGHQCSNPNGSTSCSSGTCSPTCAAGWGNCDANPDNGCETFTDGNVSHCGSCGNLCTNPNGSTSCSGGVCSPTCSAGYGNCDANPNNGCETNTNTSTGNCGACGNTCTNAHGTTACASGVCSPSCSAGWGNCDGNPNNGCETDIFGSISNCGACGTVCSNAHGTTSCSSGTCSPICDAGWGNCDANPINGCETNTNTTTAHCGACGTQCANANGTTSCVGGTCAPVCNAGYDNCDGNPVNGCETYTNGNVNHCGACGNQCTNAHGTTSCSSGVCAPICAAGWSDCDGNPNNGCETYTAGDVANCGTCGLTCTNPNGSTSCTGGICVPTCNAGFGNCDANPINGCETNTNTTTAHCGACGNQCTNPNGTTSCVAGGCVPVCSAGYANCDGNNANGCETNINNSIGNCGGCGIVCTNANGTTSCASGICAPVCSAGYGNCDANPINGCETYTDGNLSHCGACNSVCDLPNTSEVCTGGACLIQTCTAGYWNVDGLVPNGCECNDVSDIAGTCGGGADIGTLSSGQSYNATGVLVHKTGVREDQDCYTVTYNRPNPGSGTFRIFFNPNPGNLRVQIWRDNCSTVDCAGDVDYTTVCSSVGPTCTTGNSHIFHACVRAAAGQDNLCQGYTLRFQHTP